MNRPRPLPFEQAVYVTRPLLPPLDEYRASLEGIWSRQWLTNKGILHDELEAALCNHLNISNLSLVGNGTAALMLACRAHELSGEAITTPLTSPATVNALTWCGLTPVFADIDPDSLTLDPTAVESAISPRTSVIVGVHLYGMPCQVDALQAIADRYKLRVIYDGAHAFGTEINRKSVLHFGDASILSFHATKLFNTAEGGAVRARDPEIKKRIDLLKTLGIQDENTVALPGINARMSELQAALGLLNLKIVEEERSARAAIAAIYRERLRDTPGIKCYEIPKHVRDSHHYFVLLVDGDRSRVTRDQLNERLKDFNVFSRRYFHPLCSNYSFYRSLPSSAPENLRVANRAANEVLCLPFYGGLGPESAHRICDAIEYVMNV